jgi:hypothetical protein
MKKNTNSFIAIKKISVAFLVSLLLINGNAGLKAEIPKYVVGPRSCGFFSEFFAALHHAAWYDDTKQEVPVIYWDNQCPYYEPGGFNNTFNAWEYYFEPLIANTRYEPGDAIHRNYEAPHEYGFYIRTEDQACVEKLRPKMHEIIKKYIKIKPYILQIVEEFYNKNMLNNTIISVHMRGTDKYGDLIKPVHPRHVIRTAQAYANMAKLQHPNKQIKFLVASDEQRLIDFAKAKLNGTVIVYGAATRSKDGKPIHHDRKKTCGQSAKLGCDVLVEALLLAHGNYFVHTQSNVSVAVLFFNPTIIHYQHDGYAKF